MGMSGTKIKASMAPRIIKPKRVIFMLFSGNPRSFDGPYTSKATELNKYANNVSDSFVKNDVSFPTTGAAIAYARQEAAKMKPM